MRFPSPIKIQFTEPDEHDPSQLVIPVAVQNRFNGLVSLCSNLHAVGKPVGQDTGSSTGGSRRRHPTSIRFLAGKNL